MKPMKVIPIIILILAMLILILTIFNTRKKEKDILNVDGITVSIETSSFEINTENKKIVIEDKNEIRQIIQIINNLEFSEETCDGLDSYELIINGNEKYGIETYNNYHITSSKLKGEAKLTNEQTNILKQIIDKYFNN